MNGESTRPQPTNEGGRFGNDVVSIRPEDFRGDPSQVPGHPSNPFTKLFAGKMPGVPSSPETSEPADDTPELARNERATFIAQFSDGVFVRRTGGRIEQMQLSDALTFTGTRQGEPITITVPDGRIIVYGEDGSTKVLNMNELAAMQAELANEYARQQEARAAISLEQPESDMGIGEAARRVVESAEDPLDNVAAQDEPEVNADVEAKITALEVELAGLTAGLSKEQLTKLWRVWSQKYHISENSRERDYKWFENENGRLIDLQRELDGTTREISERYNALASRISNLRTKK
jgi:hypothetical protein